MGAGCYYTHNFDPTIKAFWTDHDLEWNSDDMDYQFQVDIWLEDIHNCLMEMGYDQHNRNEFWSGLHKIVLEWKYYGDGIVFKMEPHDDDDARNYNLSVGSHERCYNSLAKKLIKLGYELRTATSGYTSGVYLV